jgi:hypothetical protein
MLKLLACQLYGVGMTEPPRPPSESFGAGPNEPPTQPAATPPPYSPTPPTSGGYPPPPAGYGSPSAGYGSNDDKTWALVAHFGGAAGAFMGVGGAGWVAPLIALLVRGNESPTARAHAVAALNFQITMTIVSIVGWITACLFIGFILVLGAMVVGIIFGILAGIKANEGQTYNYPMSLKLVK